MSQISFEFKDSMQKLCQDKPFIFERVCGLHPDVWVSVGAGFAREDIKALILERGFGFTGDSITTLQGICLQIAQIPAEKVLGSASRQEILRMLLSEPRIIAELPELKQIRRQRDFYRRLDNAMQSGRVTFAHAQEDEVYHERLSQSLGESRIRNELRILSRAYEAWLEATGWIDLPMLIRRSIQTLRETGWPAQISKPKEIWVLSAQTPESLEREFWEVLGQSLTVQFISSLKDQWSELPPIQNGKNLNWQTWHTLDDATEHLADQLALEIHQSNGDKPNWDEHAILLPDMPIIRRSLKRALESRGLPLADPRDPTRLRWDEAMKWALLPLEVVAKNYERQKVISWLRNYQMQMEFPDWVNEINARGIRHSISAYQGGALAGVHSRLLELESQLGGRKILTELAEAHLKILRASIKVQPDFQWLVQFFEQSWKTFVSDMERVGGHEKRAHLLFWLEKLQSRLYEATPPVERVKTQKGVRIYRLQQAPVKPAEKLWILGLPSQWLSGEGNGTYWFSERERELLALEFSVRSAVQVHDERLNILSSWIDGSQQITLLDFLYDVDGRERESILPALKELEVKLGVEFPSEPTEMGSHPRFLKSYGAIRPLQSQEIQLPPLPRKPGGIAPELTATILDRYSRCSFQALAFHRWKLRDVREPDTELWPDIRGNILHEAVRVLMTSVDPEGHFKILPREALELAWKAKRPKGLIRSQRVENYVKSRMVSVLETFCEKEREFIQKAGTRPISLDNINFKLEYPAFSLVGQPDRIDEHSEGLFILDYKTSTNNPNGTEMIEQGYRLQLPFYAVATRKNFSKPVVGVQFVELDRRGGRKNGIFFKKFNGKQKGCLTQTTARSKSLIGREPEEIWDELEEKLIHDAQSYVQGKFAAAPRAAKRDKECSRCSIADLCGFRRIVETETEDAENSSKLPPASHNPTVKSNLPPGEKSHD